uniref:Transmembrane 9 superfamily member n=1 Tax=Chaetoceros debilis TaxID=122233 RepID=A0A7S3Q4A6_9STRA
MVETKELDQISTAPRNGGEQLKSSAAGSEKGKAQNQERDWFGYLPQSYKEGEELKLYVNTLKSDINASPIEYYRLPFCQPEDGVVEATPKIGQSLLGDHIFTSPYKIKMKQDLYCEQVCMTNVGRSPGPYTFNNRVARAIKHGYHHNWIVDDLPAVSISESQGIIYTSPWETIPGFPLGFLSQSSHEEGGEEVAYLYNHVNIELEYNEVKDEYADSDPEEKIYRVVGFKVEPFSIKHDEDLDHFDEDDEDWSPTMKNPIESCDPFAKEKKHTDYKMVTDSPFGFQPACQRIFFTYDVIWIENKDLEWVNRWDPYVSQYGYVFQNKITISECLSRVLAVAILITIVAIFRLRRKCYRYSEISKKEDEECESIFHDAEIKCDFDKNEVQFDSTHHCHPPSAPLLLAAFCGSGVQLLGTVVIVIMSFIKGYLLRNQSSLVVTTFIISYALMGGPAGYFSGRLYKSFQGNSWKKPAYLTAFGFPGIAFCIFFIVNFMLALKWGSTMVSLMDAVVLVFTFLCILTPGVFFGSWLGFKHQSIAIPDSSRLSGTQRLVLILSIFFGGLIPFLNFFWGYFFLIHDVGLRMPSAFRDIGFDKLLINFGIMLLTCVELTLPLVYFQNSYEKCWYSFNIGGASAIFFFLYSLCYLWTFSMVDFSSFLHHFLFINLTCFGIYLMTGSVGLLSSLLFHKLAHAYDMRQS